MRATSTALLALALLAAAGQALAQSPATPAAEPKPPAAAPSTAQPPERPAAPRAPLILRLDEIDGPKPTFAPSESERTPSADLPSLGEGARPLDHSQRSSPYPKQYNDTPSIQ